MGLQGPADQAGLPAGAVLHDHRIFPDRVSIRLGVRLVDGLPARILRQQDPDLARPGDLGQQRLQPPLQVHLHGLSRECDLLRRLPLGQSQKGQPHQEHQDGIFIFAKEGIYSLLW